MPKHDYHQATIAASIIGIHVSDAGYIPASTLFAFATAGRYFQYHDEPAPGCATAPYHVLREYHFCHGILAGHYGYRDARGVFPLNPRECVPLTSYDNTHLDELFPLRRNAYRIDGSGTFAGYLHTRAAIHAFVTDVIANAPAYVARAIEIGIFDTHAGNYPELARDTIFALSLLHLSSDGDDCANQTLDHAYPAYLRVIHS